MISQLVDEAIALGHGTGLTRDFLREEWTELVDAWGVESEESYAGIPRTGRRTRLGPKQREAAWNVFAHMRSALKARNFVTQAEIYGRLSALVRDGAGLGLSYVVVDEAQDLTVAQVRFLGEVAKLRTDAVFLAGDIGQRIFRLPFSWAKLGLDIRGRSHSLKVNYRTSHQIRSMADRLLPPSITDLDGVEEGRRGTVSVFDGPEPEVAFAADEGEEGELVATWIDECVACGIAPIDIGVLVRSEVQISRAQSAVCLAGRGREALEVRIATMHDAKGLEFRAVAVMACDEDVLPDLTRLSGIGDVAELEAAYETERHLLYVACTRARDRLLVSCVAPGSEFLDDISEI
jgi:superfamily I DNA/RNA helicase